MQKLIEFTGSMRRKTRMKTTTFMLGLVGMLITCLNQGSYAQEFWYMPPGTHFGYQTGIDLGHGAGFGYGVGVGFNGRRGAIAAPVFQALEQVEDEAVSGGTEVEQNSFLSPAEKLKRIEAAREKQKELQARRAQAREVTKARNVRYLNYLERQSTQRRS